MGLRDRPDEAAMLGDAESRLMLNHLKAWTNDWETKPRQRDDSFFQAFSVQSQQNAELHERQEAIIQQNDALRKHVDEQVDDFHEMVVQLQSDIHAIEKQVKRSTAIRFAERFDALRSCEAGDESDDENVPGLVQDEMPADEEPQKYTTEEWLEWQKHCDKLDAEEDSRVSPEEIRQMQDF